MVPSARHLFHTSRSFNNFHFDWLFLGFDIAASYNKMMTSPLPWLAIFPPHLQRNRYSFKEKETDLKFAIFHPALQLLRIEGHSVRWSQTLRKLKEKPVKRRGARQFQKLPKNHRWMIIVLISSTQSTIHNHWSGSSSGSSSGSRSWSWSWL